MAHIVISVINLKETGCADLTKPESSCEILRFCRPESGLKPNKKIQDITRSIKNEPSPANHSQSMIWMFGLLLRHTLGCFRTSQHHQDY